MEFKDGDILVIKNINVWDTEWYTETGDYAHSTLEVNEEVRVASNQCNNAGLLYLVKGDLVSQDFTVEEMKSIFYL